MSSQIDTILSSLPTSTLMTGDYAEICGDDAAAGFARAQGAFAASLEKTMLRYLTPASADPELLRSAWRRFLVRDGGCPETTPGARLFQAKAEPKLLTRMEPVGNRELRVATPGAEFLLGLPFGRFDGRAIVLDGITVPFRSAFTWDEKTIVRQDDYSLHLFVGHEFARVNLVETITDDHGYLGAWNEYLAAFLERAQFASAQLDEAVLRGWGNLDDDERGGIVASLRALDDAIAAGTAFFIGRKEHPLAPGFSHAFSLVQLAKMRNAMVPPRVLAEFMAGGEAEPFFFEMARESLGLLFDPFDHLQKSFAIDPHVQAYLRIDLPPSPLPKIAAADGFALRRIIDDIILRAGRTVEEARGFGDHNTRAHIRVSVQPSGATDDAVNLVFQNLTPALPIFANLATEASAENRRGDEDAIAISVPLAKGTAALHQTKEAPAGRRFTGVVEPNTTSADDASAPAGEDGAAGDAVVVLAAPASDAAPAPVAVPIITPIIH